MRWARVGSTYVAMMGLALGCSGEDSSSTNESGDGSATLSPGGTTSTGTSSTNGTGGSTSAGGAAASTAMSGSAVSTGQVDPNLCQLQGMVQAATEHSLSDGMCSQIPNYSTIYNMTIEGSTITMEQYVERYTMSGTIDAACNVSIVLASPLVREYQFTLDPDAMTGAGSYADENSSGCRSTYDISMTLMPGHA